MAEFVKTSEAAKAQWRCSERQLCRSLALPRGTYRRWHARFRAAAEIIRTPGPKKCQPLPLEALKKEVCKLAHGRKRSRGTTVLYASHAAAISRRTLQELVAEARAEHRQQERQNLQHLHWHSPDVAWAIDGAEYTKDGQGQLLLFIAAQDLASSHRFAPLPALNLTSEKVAAYLEELFQKHGPPLVLKRDNGSIFNNEAVDAVLARWHVLPLNSPAYYPRYNGAIEKAICEIKADLPSVLAPPAAWQLPRIQTILAALCLQQNAQPRRRLNGRSACEVYYEKSIRYPKRERIAIFQSIFSDASATINHMEEHERRDLTAAWREALVRWLVCQKLLSLSTKPKGVTPFSQNVVS